MSRMQVLAMVVWGDLAACFIDSCATLQLPVTGYGYVMNMAYSPRPL